MRKSSKATIIITLIVVALAAFVLLLLSSNSSTTVPTTEFFLKAGIKYETVTVGEGEDAKTETVITYDKSKAEIDQIVIDVYTLRGYKRAVGSSDKYVLVYESNLYPSTIFEEEFDVLKKNGVVLECTDPNAGSFFSNLIMPLLISVVGIIIFVILIRQANGGAKGTMDFGKTKARVNQNIKVRFSDVAGAEEEKEELQEPWYP